MNSSTNDLILARFELLNNKIFLIHIYRKYCYCLTQFISILRILRVCVLLSKDSQIHNISFLIELLKYNK